MASNNNGFADMADYLGKLSEVDPKKITIDSLQKAATFFMEQLIPKIPKSLLKKKHAAEHVKVVVKDDGVEVRFEEMVYYWRFPENGTVNQKAQHFASGTYQQNRSTIEELMTQDIMKLWKG
jgi:HK97 gp10 family phage protein